MKVTTGTNYFPSFNHALLYYLPQAPALKRIEAIAWVREKIDAGEIVIGNPILKPNQEKKLIDNRWHICE